MTCKKQLAALTILLLSVCSIQAQTVQQNQRHRIKQGVKSGELTRHETHQLVKQQKDIRHDKKEARADGVVTPAERKNIRQDKRQANRNIYRKKHNRRVRH